jgi:hypothetical protein
MELEDIMSEIDRDDERNGGRYDAPNEKADAYLFQAGDEAWAG